MRRYEIFECYTEHASSWCLRVQWTEHLLFPMQDFLGSMADSSLHVCPKCTKRVFYARQGVLGFR